jgi:HSP20 family molecular chaperone IbpA
MLSNILSLINLKNKFQGLTGFKDEASSGVATLLGFKDSFMKLFDETVNWEKLNEKLPSVISTNLNSFKELYSKAYTPPVDVIEAAEEYIIQVEIPGVTKDDFALSIMYSTVRITGIKKEVFVGEGIKKQPLRPVESESKGQLNEEIEMSSEEEPSHGAFTSKAQQTIQKKQNEIQYGTFSKTVHLEKPILINSALATFQNGVLKIVVSKDSSQSQAGVTIAIQDLN